MQVFWRRLFLSLADESNGGYGLAMNWRTSLFCLAIFLGSFSANADESFTLKRILGEPVAALDPGEKKAAVLFFVSPFCPTSNTFAPEMNAIAADFADDFAFRVVHSDTTVPAEVIPQHASLMEFTMPVLIDAEQKVAKKLGAKITPEVVVVGKDGETLYQGRINDLYLGPTKRQREATTADLRDALEAIKDGKPVAVAKTEAMGCKISGLE